MNEVLNNNIFLVKEHIGSFKSTNSYDVLDPETGDIVMECREEKLGIFTTLMRFTSYKKKAGFDIRIKTPDGKQIVRVSRGFSLFLSKVTVFDEHDNSIGGFKQKLLTVGGSFQVTDADDSPVCTLKGKWTGKEFKFMDGETELAQVSKKWAGIGKELFTNADNYILQISDAVPANDKVRQLIIAAVMCIDLVLNE